MNKTLTHINSSNNQIDISFCIPTFNRSSSVLSCVTHLLKISDLNIEIIVSDNNSSDATLTELSKIHDSRLQIRSLDFNTGTYNIYNAAQHCKGKILTWLSDEDDIEIESVRKVLDFFDNDSLLSVFVGSTVFGPRKELISFDNYKYTKKSSALNMLLNFSGCGGVFIRNSHFKKKLSEYKIFPENAYSLWNYYPVGFLGAYSLVGSLRTSNLLVCRQVRFNKTTLNWNSQPTSRDYDTNPPHFWPESIVEKAKSKVSTILLMDLNKRSKTNLIRIFIKQFRYELHSIQNPQFLELLKVHYPERVIREFQSEIKKVHFRWKIQKLIELYLSSIYAFFRRRNRYL